MRPHREIEEQGVVVDDHLATDPDASVFGFNLACAWPFPTEAAQFYRPIAERLRALDAAVYVYPEWETHITIITFVNFTLHRGVVPEQSLMARVRAVVEPLLAGPSFELVLGAPVLSRKAAILPISDPAGAIPRLRQAVRAALAQDKSLEAELTQAGLNVPGIVHSTIMRFVGEPENVPKFLARFDSAAAEARPCRMLVNELLLTTETKPYMRGGEIVARFPLTNPSP